MGGFSFSIVYITKGVDKGTINSYLKVTGGAGTTGSGGNIGIDLIHSSGDPAIFSSQDLLVYLQISQRLPF